MNTVRNNHRSLILAFLVSLMVFTSCLKECPENHSHYIALKGNYKNTIPYNSADMLSFKVNDDVLILTCDDSLQGYIVTSFIKIPNQETGCITRYTTYQEGKQYNFKTEDKSWEFQFLYAGIDEKDRFTIKLIHNQDTLYNMEEGSMDIPYSEDDINSSTYSVYDTMRVTTTDYYNVINWKDRIYYSYTNGLIAFRIHNDFVRVLD